jgi:hypothetical protein
MSFTSQGSLRTVRMEVQGLHRGEPALGLEAAELVHGLADFLVRDLPGLIDTGGEVADIAVARVAHRTDLVVTLVHEVAE